MLPPIIPYFGHHSIKQESLSPSGHWYSQRCNQSELELLCIWIENGSNAVDVIACCVCVCVSKPTYSLSFIFFLFQCKHVRWHLSTRFFLLVIDRSLPTKTEHIGLNHRESRVVVAAMIQIRSDDSSASCDQGSKRPESRACDHASDSILRPAFLSLFSRRALALYFIEPARVLQSDVDGRRQFFKCRQTKQAGS